MIKLHINQTTLLCTYMLNKTFKTLKCVNPVKRGNPTLTASAVVKQVTVKSTDPKYVVKRGYPTPTISTVKLQISNNIKQRKQVI